MASEHTTYQYTTVTPCVHVGLPVLVHGLTTRLKPTYEDW